jgi:tetratricopeptide (TPR) repeat protein
LQTITGDPIGSSGAIFLPGLTDDDALKLWREYKVSGSKESLLPFFNRIEKHPLLIQSLAGEVSRDREDPGNFDKWQEKHPGFDPFSLPLKQVKSHVLEYALSGLDEKERQVLNTIAAFRMPGQYDTLAALLVGAGKPCAEARELDEILTALEDRGLVGWDKRANRYDLHPIVRGVVWSGLPDEAKQGVYTSLHAHFEVVPKIDDYLKVESLEDLTPAVELYNTLIGLGRYEDASDLFYDRLEHAMHFRLSASRQRVEMLERLFPDGLDELPRLNKQGDQAFVLNALALGYQFGGQPGRAAPLSRRVNSILSETGNDENLGISLENLSDNLRLKGGLRESEESARRALGIGRGSDDSFREAVSLHWLGLVLAARDESDDSGKALLRSLGILTQLQQSQSEGVTNAYLAQRAIWMKKYAEALLFADQAWECAQVDKYAGDFIRASRMQGEASLGLNDLSIADERLHYALTRARAVNLVHEELPALIALAELRRRQEGEKEAREFLDGVWEFAERGPYPLSHADALNVLAQIERDAGNTEEAIKAATKAYQLAWCAGPPYAYHWGLVKAQKHLEELGAPLPDMPPFDESKYEPMPEVEIDPDDEFHVGSS